MLPNAKRSQSVERFSIQGTVLSSPRIMTTNIQPFARVAPADGSANIHHYLNGQLYAGTSGRFADVYNPASGQVSGRLSFATKVEVDLAVSAAAKA